LQAVIGVHAVEERDPVVLSQASELRAHFLELAADARHLPVEPVRLQVVGEHSLPEGLDAVVQGMPVPVGHHVRPGGEVAVDVESCLTIVRRVLVGRGGRADGLGVGLRDEVAGPLQGPGEVAAEGSSEAVQAILHLVVRVLADHVEVPRDGGLVDVGPSPPDEVLHHELVGALELADDAGLPGQEVRGQLLLVPLPFQLVTGVDGAVPRRELVPVFEELAPVGEAPDLVQPRDAPELLLEVVQEAELDVPTRGSIGARLVVDLVPDHGRVVLEARDDPSNHAPRVMEIGRVRDVHVLARPIEALGSGADLAEGGDEDLRMLSVQPGGDGVGGRAEGHLDVSLVHPFDDLLHPGELELPLPRLPAAPRRLADTDDGDPGLLHEPGVLLQPLVRHVLVVVGRTIENGLEPVRLVRPGREGGDEEAGGRQQDDRRAETNTAPPPGPGRVMPALRGRHLPPCSGDRPPLLWFATLYCSLVTATLAAYLEFRRSNRRYRRRRPLGASLGCCHVSGSPDRCSQDFTRRLSHGT
jgi:hypothetical protein